MNYKVHMLAFMDRGTVRNVEVPDSEVAKVEGNKNGLLELIFQYGQNEFALNHERLPSVSVGDVVEVDGQYEMVRPFGYLPISKEQFDNLPDHIGTIAYWKVDELLEKKS